MGCSCTFSLFLIEFDISNCDCFTILSTTFIVDASGTLTDALIVELSDRISSKEKLRTFGMKILKLPEHKIESAVTNNPRSIQSAAYDVLSLWVKQQTNRKEAYSNLKVALGGSELGDLVDRWIENSLNHSNISTASKLKILRLHLM